MAKCSACNGSGNSMRLGGPNSWRCSNCGGTGKVPGRTRSPSNPCNDCGGSGRTIRLGGPNSSGTCFTCNGSGRGTKSSSTRWTPSVSEIRLAEELQKLVKLHAMGALTDAEFAAAKAKVLSVN